MPDRLISLHFLAAPSGFEPERKACTASEAGLTEMLKVAAVPDADAQALLAKGATPGIRAWR